MAMISGCSPSVHVGGTHVSSFFGTPQSYRSVGQHSEGRREAAASLVDGCRQPGVGSAWATFLPNIGETMGAGCGIATRAGVSVGRYTIISRTSGTGDRAGSR